MTDDSTIDTPPLTIERVEGAAPSRLVVCGEMDAFTAVDVRAAVVEGEPGDVDLDLSGVTFIDSSGLGTLIVMHQLLEANGRRMVITDRSPIVERLFELSGVSTRFHLGRAAD
jgi:anti-anti-sigma factor